MLLMAGAFCLAGCRSGSDLRDQFQLSDYTLSFDERLRLELAAPIIVLGKVTDVEVVGTPTKSLGDPRINTQLTNIRISVEMAIKGGPLPNQLRFSLFTYSQQNDATLGVPQYNPAVGQRRIYFLKRWSDGYRSIGDVTNYNLHIESGTHEEGVCGGISPGCCIARLLLVPGQNFDADQFAKDIGPAAAASQVLCSRAEARALLEKLTTHRDKRIADAAIDIISMENWR
jgi:hypothetical protein